MQPDKETIRAVHTENGYIAPQAPFDFDKTLHFLRGFAPLQDEYQIWGQQLSAAINMDEQNSAVFTLESTGTVEKPELAYRLHTEHALTAQERESTLAKIRFFLSLDDNLASFYKTGLNDTDFAPIVHEMYGYHQVKFITPFQSACWATLAQRNLRSISIQMKQALLERYGNSLEVEGHVYRAFPEPHQLEHVSEAELLLAVKNTRKAEYLHTLIKAFNNIEADFLYSASYEELESWLRSIKGIGEWSASFILLRGLGRMERVPLSEKVMLAAASRLYGKGRELTRTEVAKLAEPYGNDKGYWAHYLRVGA